MVLKVSHAAPADVEHIARIHVAAFNSNALLHAQFPTPASLAALPSFLGQEMLHTIENSQDTNKVILVVRDSEANDQIISFARWDLPDARQKPNLDVLWHEDIKREYFDGYFSLTETAKDRVIGKSPCYRLTFIGTDPAFQNRGAATILLEWGLSRARQDNIPVYLESTTAALAWYRKFGFIALDGLSMTLPGARESEGPKVYEELCMLRSWGDDKSGMDHWDSSLNISSLRLDYEAGIKPQHVVQAVYDRIDAYIAVQSSVWIYLQPIGEVMKAARELYTRWPNPEERPPLWGIPFSVKDNIDVAGVPTTIGCPALAFTPTSSAPVYQSCIDAGGLFIGKTNMEQLATGMTGCRSPYGTLHSTFSKSHIVGGSSSGSAVSVSGGLVSFSLGSDTAGSIRLPALYNGIVGFKPTKGTVSAWGVYPASRHHDAVSFLASTVQDAETVWEVCRGFDKRDIFSKRSSLSYTSGQFGRVTSFRFGVPPDAALDKCSLEYRRKFARVTEVLETIAGELVDLEWSPFASASDMLYSSSFALERPTILPDGWFEGNKQLLHPVTKQVFENILAQNCSAMNLFRDLHKQAELTRAVEEILTCGRNASKNEAIITVLVVPTAPFHPTIEEVAKDPIGVNNKLGAFSQLGNVLDLAAIAIPCGTYDIDRAGSGGGKTTLPFGVTVLAGAGSDEPLSIVAKSVEEALGDLHEDE